MGNPKLAGGSGDPGICDVEAKVVFCLPDLTVGPPVEVRKIAVFAQSQA